MKFMLYIEDESFVSNNITIKCNDREDLALYAAGAIRQKYKKVIAVVEEDSQQVDIEKE